MAQNVTIAGASYLGVPRIEMPKTGGGTAVFVDTSDANAAAGDITKGKTAYVGGTKITGTLEASSSGVAKETWVIKSDATGELVTTQISFTSNGQKFTSIGATYTGLYVVLCYGNVEVAGYDPGTGGVYEFDNEAYRTITFDTPPTGDLLTWLQTNATRQVVDSGGAKETWVIKDTAPVDENSYELAKTNISFASGGANFVAFEVATDGVVIWLKYYPTANTVFEPGSFEPGMGEDRFSWRNNAYKTITFDTHPTGALLTWLQANATRQVVEYLTTETDLIKVANAIRAKSGTTAKLSFPDGFALAISNISTVAPGSNYGLITYNGSELTIS